jgi:hypothetical protein
MKRINICYQKIYVPKLVCLSPVRNHMLWVVGLPEHHIPFITLQNDEIRRLAPELLVMESHRVAEKQIAAATTSFTRRTGADAVRRTVVGMVIFLS